jgi:HPt (histidine-containing phosphotransfer) domain-containing protein
VAGEIIDELRELMGQMGNQPLQQLNDVFVRSAQNHLSGMRKALHDGNAAQLGREAHRLRGASGSLGAQRVSRVSALIEQCANTGDLAPVEDLLQQLQVELSAFEQAIVPMLS